MMGGLRFPRESEDLDDAYNAALAAGVMQREDPSKVSYWARFEYLAFDVEDGTDVFYNQLSGQFVRVERKESE